MKKLPLAALWLCVFTPSVAQKLATVCGEYTYYVPENVALEQARQTALHRARVAGLVAEFNQTVYQSNTTIVTNRNGESSVDLFSIGGSDARGEWIEDTEPPRYEVYYDQNMLVVRATVCGKAREIKKAGISVASRVLRNGTEPRFESAQFKTGDDLYLWFQSPVDGYVTVYLLDRNKQTVYCLLPYRNSPQGTVQVQHDKEYVFFKRDRKQADWYDIDEYTLTAEHEVEWNELYVVFSPNPYAKAVGGVAHTPQTARELPFDEFSKWLTKIHARDPEMTVRKHLIEVNSK